MSSAERPNRPGSPTAGTRQNGTIVAASRR